VIWYFLIFSAWGFIFVREGITANTDIALGKFYVTGCVLYGNLSLFDSVD
jgi:hypothetical protein